MRFGHIIVKSQLLDYCHHTSHRNAKYKIDPSTGKCMLTIFWKYKGIIHQEYMVKGETMNQLRSLGKNASASST
jgi:hypothetical protein